MWMVGLTSGDKVKDLSWKSKGQNPTYTIPWEGRPFFVLEWVALLVLTMSSPINVEKKFLAICRCFFGWSSDPDQRLYIIYVDSFYPPPPAAATNEVYKGSVRDSGIPYLWWRASILGGGNDNPWLVQPINSRRTITFHDPRLFSVGGFKIIKSPNSLSNRWAAWTARWMSRLDPRAFKCPSATRPVLHHPPSQC